MLDLPDQVAGGLQSKPSPDKMRSIASNITRASMISRRLRSSGEGKGTTRR
jgi:hypothetical protein